MTEHRRPYTTFDSGVPATSDEHSLTVGPDGPIVLQDAYLVQKMQQFNRERVPERVVHAKGGGAFGRFRVTNDVSALTKAVVFQPGKETELVVRFSTVAGEMGSPDTARDPRGFAVKFYTELGNYDMVGNNTPVFFIRDPQKFQDFIHSQKRRADNHLRDNNMQWDFWTLSPESAHQVTWLMGDRGIPRTWRHMNGYSSHTYMWVNEAGERFWVKYHFKTDQGIECLTNEEAEAIAGADPDAHLRDLWEAIERREHPTWSLKVQVMPFEDAADYRFNPFDLTKVWPHGDYPLIDVGTMTLDRNPENYFAEIEQSTFEPSNLIPGIGPSPDKMLLARLFSYHDTHLHRVGTNAQQLPVNRPRAPVHSYNRDGAMRYENPGDPVYAPNSAGGPVAQPERFGPDPAWGVSGEILRAAATRHAEDDDFSQAGAMYRHAMDEAARGRLVATIAGHLGSGVTPEVVERALDYWRNVDGELGAAVAKAVAGDAGAAR
jgi:catalase